MIDYPTIDPVIFSLGPLEIRWYGMMYLLGFLAAYLLGRKRARCSWSPMQESQVEDFIFYGALGAVLGGRVGYVLFYGFDRFVDDPLWLIRIWEGGMAFHGGLLGVIFALWLYALKIGCSFVAICYFVAPLAPIGLGLGRLANFINAELYGRAAQVPWAMVFPTDPEQIPRHPSQLYQAAMEGLLLFVVIWFTTRQQRPPWFASGLFLTGYGCARFVAEFYREPDAALVLDWMTRGQLLSLPMLVGGIVLLVIAARSPETPAATDTASSSAAPAAARSGRRKRKNRNKKRPR